MEKIAAIVLAAGSSSRLGKPKQLLRFGGTTLLRRTINAALGAGCDPVVVVLGSNETEVREEIAQLPVVATANAAWVEGIGTSIRAGVARASEHDEVSAVVLLVCDQPFISADVVRILIGLRASAHKPIAAAQYDATIGVPALFDRSIFQELLGLPDADGAKRVILSDPERVALCPFPGGAIDIDTAGDYERLIKDSSVN